MSLIDMSCFDRQIEDDEIDIYDPEIFEMQLDLIEDNSLHSALMEKYEDDPRDAWQHLLFWEDQLGFSGMELGMAVAA